MKQFSRALVLCLFASAATIAYFAVAAGGAAKSDTLVDLLVFPAPPPAGTTVEPAQPRRPEAFYAKDKVPDEEAPIEELMDYWTHHGLRSWEEGYFPKPSKRALERIKEQVDKDPSKLTQVLRLLPPGKDSAEWVKKIYGEEVSANVLPMDWRYSVRSWLESNSDLYIDRLAQLAAGISDEANYVSNYQPLLSLARVDWERAKPIVERLLVDGSAPNSQVVAKWAQYIHALTEGTDSDAAAVREELKSIVGNRNASPGQRDLALDALVKEREWSGRDDWYFSLLSDETLLELRTDAQTLTGLTTIINESVPGRYRDRLISIVKSGDPNVRSAAAQALSRVAAAGDAEAAEALLPWLSDRSWAKDANGARSTLIKFFENSEMPEAVPGLIDLLDETASGAKDKSDRPAPAAPSPEPRDPVAAPPETDLFPFRNDAVRALLKQADPRAGAALRRILLNGDGELYASPIVRAVYASGGFTATEVAEAVESAVRDAVRLQAAGPDGSNVEGPQPPRREAAILFLGGTLDSDEAIPAESVLVLAGRIRSLDAREPEIADRLRMKLSRWKGAAVNLSLLQDLGLGRARAAQVVRILASRKSIREELSSELSAARREGGPLAEAVAACVLEDPAMYDEIVREGEMRTRASLYSCARLIRASLPLDAASRDFSSGDGILSLAAEKYLETVDTREARAVITAKYGAQRRIMGATYAFGEIPYESPSTELFADLCASVDSSLASLPGVFVSSEMSDADVQEKLRLPFETDASLETVYSFRNYLVRIYPDRAVLSFADNTRARFRERILRQEEVAALKSFLDAREAEEIKPTISMSEEFPTPVEFIAMGRSGGYRVFVAAKNPPTFVSDLDGLLSGMAAEPSRLRYRFEESVAGAEVLFEAEGQLAETVWKRGDDLRVLILDSAGRRKIEREMDVIEDAETSRPEFDPNRGYAEQIKRRERALLQSFSWHRIADGSRGEPVGQPDEAGFLTPDDGTGFGPSNGWWKGRTQTFEVRADETGLYKVSGGEVVKLQDGSYSYAVVTPDGRWAVAQKYIEPTEDRSGDTIVRVNLATKSERIVAIKTEKDRIEPVSYIASLGKVLISAQYYDEHGHASEGDEPEDDLTMTGEADFFLLDPATGIVTPARGDYRPFSQQTFRQLQPTGRPNEFWAAVPHADWTSGTENKWTEIGVTNSRTGSFKRLLTLPRVFFGSMAMWVDDRVYFAYRGHVVSVPKPKLPAAN